MLRNRWQPASGLNRDPGSYGGAFNAATSTVELPLPANDLNGR